MPMVEEEKKKAQDSLDVTYNHWNSDRISHGEWRQRISDSLTTLIEAVREDERGKSSIKGTRLQLSPAETWLNDQYLQLVEIGLEPTGQQREANEKYHRIHRH